LIVPLKYAGLEQRGEPRVIAWLRIKELVRRGGGGGYLLLGKVPSLVLAWGEKTKKVEIEDRWGQFG